MRFIVAIAEDDEPFAEVCRRFGISRKTGYKWVERYEQIGPSGLEALRPVARSQPHRLADAVADLVVQARKQHPFWGPRKLKAWLSAEHPELTLPAASTIGELLKSRGLIRPRRRRLRVPLHTSPLSSCDRPNALWCADFKGHFALGDKSRCHALTITDGYSRYLLACEALCEPKTAPTREQFERVFREFGLPERLRTDNGAPFASKALGGLSDLAVWWIKLGIVPERIEPGHPEQNGRHERMHRTLGEEAANPPGATRAEQQRAFDRFRHEYNDQRPHEALGQKPPAKVYVTSARVYPERLREPEYDREFVVRRLDPQGRLMRRGTHLKLARALAMEPVGLREIDDGRWHVFYGPILLGTLDDTASKPRFLRPD
jgi:transposase InsO family protein